MHNNVKHDENIETLFHHVYLSRCSEEMVTLSEDSRAIAIYIADYVANNLKECFDDCCNELLTSDSGSDYPDFPYVGSNFIKRTSYNSINKFGKLYMYGFSNSKICG